MPSAVPLTAKRDTLDAIRLAWLDVDVWIRLGVPGLIAQDTTTLAMCLAVECTFPGYVPRQLVSWSAATLPSSSASIVSTSSSWTPTNPAGTGDVSGYFLVNAAATKLYGVQTFDLPFFLNIPFGESLLIPVNYLLDTDFA